METAFNLVPRSCLGPTAGGPRLGRSRRFDHRGVPLRLVRFNGYHLAVTTRHASWYRGFWAVSRLSREDGFRDFNRTQEFWYHRNFTGWVVRAGTYLEYPLTRFTKTGD